jgi:subtilisin-like proprotein convertase family protein
MKKKTFTSLMPAVGRFFLGVVLVLAGFAANAQSFSGTTGTVQEATNTGSTFTAQVACVGTLSATNYLSLNVQLAYYWMGDIQITLTSPGGTVFTLLDQPGAGNCSGDALSMTFAGSAAASVNPVTTLAGTCNTAAVSTSCPVTAAFHSGVVPVGGTLNVGTFFSSLAGTTANGPWTLTVRDFFNDGGVADAVVCGWSVSFAGITTPVCNFSPVLPATVTLNAAPGFSALQHRFPVAGRRFDGSAGIQVHPGRRDVADVLGSRNVYGARLLEPSQRSDADAKHFIYERYRYHRRLADGGGKG